MENGNLIDELKNTLPSIMSVVPGLKKKTANEMAGPCPWCGGSDRFVTFLDSGRFMCRQCMPKGGDIISYYCKAEGTDLAGLKKMYLDDAKQPSGKQKETGRYHYHDAAGNILYFKIRLEPGRNGRDKEFIFKHGNVTGRGCDAVLYNLPAVIKADTIYITEGEKHADIMNAWGLCATSLDSGSNSKLTEGMVKYLSGKKIVILPDNDSSGRLYRDMLTNSLHGKAVSVKVVELPGLSEKGDLIDWTQAGHSKDELLELVASSLEWKPRPEGDSGEESLFWPEPVLFGEIDTPCISAEYLPGSWLKDFTRDVISSTQTPPDMAVMFALSTVAACIQKRWEVSPYGDAYIEPLNLWTLTALDPANRKTAVKNELTSPLIIWEREEFKRLQSEIGRVNIERDVNLKRIDQLKAQAAKVNTTDEDRMDYLKKIRDIEENTPEELRPPRIWADDVTPERFQMLLAENGERVAVLSDEGGIFEIMGGLYSDGRVNINVFLQSHAGAPVRVERQGRHVDLEKPASTFGLAVQPEVIADLSKGSKRKFRGLGALARFLYCIPKSTVGSRNIKRHTTISETVRLNYQAGILQLLNIKPIYDETGRERPRILTLSEGALTSWETFSQYIESKLGVDGEYYSIQDWCGKLPGAALRIAGNLHVVEYGESTHVINKQTIERALDLCELLIVHAQAAFSLMGADEAVNDAKHILKWITDSHEESFNQRDCLKRFEGRFKRVDRLKKSLEVLTERHIISEPQKRTTAGRPGIYYRVNPTILEGAK